MRHMPRPTLTTLFPFLALAGSLLAWWQPGWFTPLKPSIVPLLGIVMFGMGMTLTGTNFLDVLRRPLPVLLGVSLQFLLMPFAAWLLATVAGLPPQLAVGLILVGCSPGGTASNVICYLARGGCRPVDHPDHGIDADRGYRHAVTDPVVCGSDRAGTGS
jgi:BASS family bile acid:Na+ symporter